CEEHSLGEVVALGDEALAHPDGHDRAGGAGADLVAERVGGAGRVLRLARPVAVLDVIVGIVGVVDEVPAGDGLGEAGWAWAGVGGRLGRRVGRRVVIPRARGAEGSDEVLGGDAAVGGARSVGGKGTEVRRLASWDAERG